MSHSAAHDVRVDPWSHKTTTSTVTAMNVLHRKHKLPAKQSKRVRQSSYFFHNWCCALPSPQAEWHTVLGGIAVESGWVELNMKTAVEACWALRHTDVLQMSTQGKIFGFLVILGDAVVLCVVTKLFDTNLEQDNVTQTWTVSVSWLCLF